MNNIAECLLPMLTQPCGGTRCHQSGIVSGEESDKSGDRIACNEADPIKAITLPRHWTLVV